ncbi:hypothetical protein [Hirschia litorea]|uniref:Uncharacterized protein n=1 Tax=Hirschia litorea TaxID=1199156 RepID=A0ABW2IHH3_9PROT
MKSYEVLARRYCAFLGEDPDEEIEGLPIWKIALADLEAAINALETFGVSARAPMTDENIPLLEEQSKPERSPPNLRCVA